MAAKDSSDISSDSDSSLELEIETDGVIRPFMFEPQHGTSSEDESDSNLAQDTPEAVEYTTDRTRLHDHVLAIAIGVPALIAKLCFLKRKASVTKKWTFSGTV